MSCFSVWQWAVNIDLFQTHPDDLSTFSRADYYPKHRLESGVQEITVQVNTLPRYVVLDPYLHLMDKNTVDNVKRID